MAAVTMVLGVLPELRTLRVAIGEQLPRFDLERFDKLEQYALALAHATTLHRSAFASKAPLAELGAELGVIRDRLLADAAGLAGHGWVDGEPLKRCEKVNGYRALATDIFTLVAVFKEAWSRVEGKTPVTLTALNEAGNWALELLAAVGVRERGSMNAADAARTRQRAFVLFSRAYGEARRAVAYRRANQGDVNEITPSLYVGRGRRGRRREQEVAPALPAAAPTAESDAKALEADDGSALPVTNPMVN